MEMRFKFPSRKFPGFLIGCSLAALAAAAGLIVSKNLAVWTAVAVARLLAPAGDDGRLAEHLDSSSVLIPAGDFWLGCAEGAAVERPRRRIFLDAYRIDRFEVTHAQYRRFLLSSGEPAPSYWQGTHYPEGESDYPVVGVSWTQAQAYCQWNGKRLPSEAEWEKACRGSDGWMYPWGDEWQPESGNFGLYAAEHWPQSLESGWGFLRTSERSLALPHPARIGAHLRDRSSFGVMDMAGNVSEWTLDWYTWTGYAKISQRNPLGLSPPWNHSVRGGAWFDRLGQQHAVADLGRCTRRNSSHSYDDPRLGFRCAQPFE